jgi:hypothetical protein
MLDAATIRDCTTADLPWLTASADAAYRGLISGFSVLHAEAWLRVCIDNPDIYVLRGETHAAVAHVMAYPWAPGRKCCDLLYLFGTPGRVMEPMRLVRVIDERRLAAGCQEFFINSIYADLSPLARRLGGVRVGETWQVGA